ncbi:HAD-IIIC family phosphatase [Gemmata sp. G18]|uniref:HAD-IIIC family phosphatase n=1 Tax=Gemmata palustris TaxID=2822762 RepID=A0ABS5BRA7_9BACT|nr:HAD-IIIC family phosphatase [Gemmata palustris]MBP3956205.1 HAD-IIIC family phosphatase [Gemmata palustris]
MTGLPEPAASGAGARQAARALATALGKRKEPLARSLVPQLFDGWDKFAGSVAGGEGEIEAFVRRELLVFVDYLKLYFETGSVDYKYLYIGEKRKQLYDARLAPDARAALTGRVLDADAAALRSGLANLVDAPALALLDATLADIRAVVTARAARHLSVLFVGDCVHLDVVAFLTAPAAEDGVTVDATFVTSKNPFKRREELRAVATRTFDIVFFSPYTYEFCAEYGSLSQWRRALTPAEEVRRIAEDAAKQTESDLNDLSALFECPIVVHNSAGVRRHEGGALDRVKGLLTRRVRRGARRIVNTRLQAYVAARNAATFPHLFILDEEPILAQHGDVELGRLFYNSDLQHPAVLGKHLARAYRDFLFVRAHLFGRKLVVCDLDNTLWRGEIGEGAVEHYADRQRLLKRLREKGVVLAVNSKNDAARVHWRGAVLSEGDFVNQQINWDHKATNMDRIRAALNLKFKDYVFIDDRADQLALVADSMPEILGMDATSDRTWRLLELWADLLAEQEELDRTQQYREKDLREQFLSTTVPDVDPGAMFAKLGLRVTIREAGRADYKRVVELVNRTNQFNLAGSRTSFREIEGWGSSPRAKVLVAEGADNFGAMGLVCVAVVELDAAARIPIFVLSCRVFGYAFETAMLNAIIDTVRITPANGAAVIRGAFHETAHNQPCRSMYPDHGFQLVGTEWVLEGNARSARSIPHWLSVTGTTPA